MPRVADLRVKIFADTADLKVLARMARDPLIKGFTTNPTLMRRSGVEDYQAFAQAVLASVGDRPISFEVFADDFPTIEAQAHEIASWGHNVYVKVPVTNTEAEFSGPLVHRLSSAGVQVNVTAVLTVDQAARVADCLSDVARSFVSVFAGRIADTGCDPVPIVGRTLELLASHSCAEVIWASPREVLNIFQADAVGCHAIATTGDLLAKLPLVGKDLEQLSLETVMMFRRDAVEAGYTIDVSKTYE